jgi:hypothetical protein
MCPDYRYTCALHIPGKHDHVVGIVGVPQLQRSALIRIVGHGSLRKLLLLCHHLGRGHAVFDSDLHHLLLSPVS